MASFLKQFYEQAASIPPNVLLQTEVEETLIIEQWLRQKSGNSVVLDVPREGQAAELVTMAAENASEMLASLQAQWRADEHKHEQALREVAEALHLAAPPARIECYDISNTQGTAIVGSMVVFIKGVPRKADYRKFNIKTVTGEPNDFAAMREMLTRRFKRYIAERETPQRAPGQKADSSFAALPDLLIVDGGKGQLSVAIQVLQEFDLTQVPVAGLAKQHEEFFIPQQSDSIMLPRRSQGLFLVQRIRDEAHRFAITAHRALRAKKGLASRLDSISGIGHARRLALLKRFGSLEGIRAASVDELATIVPRRVAEELKAKLD
jgi:excinuclease ABC subunit C